jgi:hypothetical protein
MYAVVLNMFRFAHFHNLFEMQAKENKKDKKHAQI